MVAKIDVLGVKIDSTSIERVLEKIRSANKKPIFLVTVNPEFVMQAQTDLEFKAILNAADIAIPDGSGLRLAHSFPEIIPGRILVERLLHSGYRTFFLGGTPGTAQDMALKYVGEWDSGEKNIREKETDRKRILSKINAFRPDVVLVAYGAPAQEKWIFKNLEHIHAKAIIGVGGTFDYLTGKSKVPPGFVSRIGIEWLWRLIHEPWRWKRQLRLIDFLFLVAKQRLGVK